MPSQYEGYPPLAAVGTVRVEVYGMPLVQQSTWDVSTWDGALWHGEGWQDATPLSVNAQITWGVDDNSGAISYPAAGSWSVQTYDPNRLLDPSNTQSPFAPYLKPGGLFRIMYNSHVVRVGFIDEISFDMAAKTGDIRGSDGISLMAKAKVPEGMAHSLDAPITLRAFAQWALTQGQVAESVSVEAPGSFDPAVGFPIDEAASVWQHITTAAYDALYAVWLDNNGVIRFRYFGTPKIEDIDIGGEETNSIAIDSVKTVLTLQNVFNHAMSQTDQPMQDNSYWDDRDQSSIDIWGDLLLKRDRKIPAAFQWVTQLVKDRGAASVQYEIGTIRPQTEEQFLSLLNLGMVSQVRLRVEGHGTRVFQGVNVLGGRIEANTESGWSAGLTTYQPAAAWYGETKYMQERLGANIYNEIIEPNLHNSDSATAQINVGAAGALRSILLNFPAIDWAKMASFQSAFLWVYRPEHDDGEMRINEDGHITAERVNGTWNATTNWPGPAMVTTGQRNAMFKSDIPQWYGIDVSQIVQSWAPGSLGGIASQQLGIKLRTTWQVPRGNDPEHMLVNTPLSTFKPYLQIRWGV